MKPPFDPTSCSCRMDRNNCKTQPGHLLPGQLKAIAKYLGKTIEETKKYFWNSPGMVVLRSGVLERIRTITPRFKKKKCVFLRKNGDCGIYPVAPFGCRYFDVHMNAEEGQKRAMWGLHYLLENKEEYEAMRESLPEATHYKPRAYE